MNPLIESIRSYLKTEESDRVIRACLWCAMYKEGKTLSEIGRLFNVSRERVRQVIEPYGMTRKNGGAVIKRKCLQDVHVNKMAERKQAKAMRWFGCSVEEVDRISNGLGWRAKESPALAYFDQRRSAILRGIEWNLTLRQWWDIWQDSGKWSLRGRTAQAYCMSRKGDQGAYSPENVEIKTNRANIQESYQTPQRKLRLAARHSGVIAKARLCLDLREKGLSYKQIGQQTSLTPNTVGGYIVMAKKHRSLES